MSSADRPNVLVVFTDQQRWDTVGAYGSPLDITPNLDAAAEEGTVLEQAITSQPVCGPTRACLQTGQYATECGVFTNGCSLPDVDHLIARQFNEAGYETGYVGKWHLAGDDDRLGPVDPADRGGYEDYWKAADVLEHTSHPYEGSVYDEDGEESYFDGYRVDALTDMAVEFIEGDRDAPFFCVLSHLEPHHQNDMNRYVAPEGYAYDHRNPWVPEDLEDRPGDWYEELPDYYGIVERIDETYGRLLDTLEAQGELENTVVLFVSDHGSHFRTRNAEYKRSCHESSVRVPAVLRGPGFEGGNRVEEPVSLVDLPATLLDAAGIDVPAAMSGESVAPLVAGETEDWKDEVFIQPISGEEVGRALRTDRWKYSVYAPDADAGETPQPDQYVERYLYDLHADPHEEVNLVGRDDYRAVADRLRERLRERVVAVEGEPVAIERAAYPA
jgi:arylsulfatase A-like enzyme